MKKLLTLICGALLGVVSIWGVACADSPAGLQAVKDPRISDFMQNCVMKNVDSFVFDDRNGDELTRRFDTENEVYKGKSLSQTKVLHAEEVNRLLREGKEVRYTDNVLSDWVFCELQKRGVECETLTVSWYDKFRISYPVEYTVVVIPQIVGGSKQWYVCDVSGMSQFKSVGIACYDSFVFYPLKDFLDLYGEGFNGAVVNDREYRYFKNGVGVPGGRNLFCWLSQEGHSASVATDIMADSPVVGLRFISSPNYYEKDLFLFKALRKFAKLPGAPLCEAVLC